jgi:outer membrane lipoprotein-sorting protein
MRSIVFAIGLAAMSMSASATKTLPSEIMTGLSHATVLRAEFTQTKTIPALTRPLVTSGRFTYAREQGLLWRIERPYKTTFSLGSNGIVELDAAGNPRRQSVDQSPGLQHVSRIFNALFELDLATLEKYFSVAVTGDASRWSMVLTPQSALKKAFKTISVRGGRFVEEVTMDEANGDVTVLRFRNTGEAQTVTDEERRLLSAR